MKQQTTDDFKKILEAAQKKAAEKATAKFSTNAGSQEKPQTPTPPPPAPKPQPEAKPSPKPELSNTTFADLFPTNNAQFCAPMPFTAPTPAKANTQTPAADQKTAAAALQIVDYSEKAFAVIGDTKPIKEKLMSLNGRFNPYLKCGAGYIFSKKHLQAVREALKIAA